MLAASDKYRDEATAVWHANHFAIFKFGRNQHGGMSIGILTETFAGAGGARSFADGVDIGGEIPNPISRMANVETIEATFPDPLPVPAADEAIPAAPGAGAAAPAASSPSSRTRRPTAASTTSSRARAPGSHERGPGRRLSRRRQRLCLGQAPRQRSAGRRSPQRSTRCAGEQQPVSWGVFPLMGVGRPAMSAGTAAAAMAIRSQREPERVLDDESPAIGLEQAARDDLSASSSRTARSMRRAPRPRRKRVVEGSADSGGRGGVNDARISATLAGRRRRHCCRACGHRLAPAGTSWKQHAARLDDTGEVACRAPDRRSRTGVVLRQFCCPKCAGLLDTETAMPDDRFPGRRRYDLRPRSGNA